MRYSGILALALVTLSPSLARTAEMRVTWYQSGSITASGARFHPDDPTIAASRTLPFGTILHLTNPHTGADAYVMVQDRGPVSHRFDLDISRGAARRLGILQRGVATMRVQILNK